MEIERHHYELAYQLGRRIREGNMRLTEARDEVARAGVKPSSAVSLINNLRHMLEGTRYTRATSIEATKQIVTTFNATAS